MVQLPLAAMERIIRDIGAERVADNAKVALKECLEEELEYIVRKADQLAKHAGRTTIMKEDILLAKK